MAVPELSPCEIYPAYGPWHIRKVGLEGQKFGGGLKGMHTLCGRTFEINGWDLEVKLTDVFVSKGGFCIECGKQYHLMHFIEKTNA